MLAVIALVISLAALVVSWTSLYLTSLGPAEIEVDDVDSQLRLSDFSEGHPRVHQLTVAVFVSNTGARGGLLEDLRAIDLEWLGSGSPFWIDVWRTTFIRDPTANSPPVHFPLALEGGDVITGFLFADLQPVGGPLEEQARLIGGMERLAVILQWTFARTSGLPARSPWIPVRFRRARQRVTRSIRIELDASAYRAQAIQYWEHQPEYAHLADMANAGDASQAGL